MKAGICYLNMNEFEVRGTAKHDSSLHVREHVVEDGHPDSDLLPLAAFCWHLHVNEERQHSNVLKKSIR